MGSPVIGLVGGSGFIGTTISRKLTENAVAFRILDKRISSGYPHKCMIVDVRDPDKLCASLGGCSALINLAAEHRDDVIPRSLYNEVNVGGARNVCAAAEKNRIDRIIFSSSVAVYGFAPAGTDESGRFNPFNDYGRTKIEAEAVYREWLARDAVHRSLVIVRPTVVFGERNRGNVYNLLRQIAGNRFIMVGKGRNRKSLAYVENVADFLVFSLGFGSGEHLFNYIDKPDLDMNDFVAYVRGLMGKKTDPGVRLPYWAGLVGGALLDVAAMVTGRKLPISAIRIRKFCAETLFSSSTIVESGFRPSFSLAEGLKRTVEYEFLHRRAGEELFYSE